VIFVADGPITHPIVRRVLGLGVTLPDGRKVVLGDWVDGNEQRRMCEARDHFMVSGRRALERLRWSRSPR